MSKNGKGAPQALTVQQQRRRVEHHTIPARCQKGRNVPCGFEPPELQKALVCFHRLANELSRAGFALRTNNDGLWVDISGIRNAKDGGVDEPASPGSPGQPRTPREGRFAGQSTTEVSTHVRTQ
jgi:hypothetical protein